MGARLVLPLLVLVVLAIGGGLFFVLSGSGERGGAAQATTEVEPETTGPAADLASAAGLAADDGAEARVAVDEPLAEPAAEVAPEGLDVDDSDPDITGHVVDRLGNPVADALVLASDRPGFPLDMEITDSSNRWMRRWEARTGQDGRFDLKGPDPGNLRLAVFAAGFAPLERDDVPLPEAESVVLDPLVVAPGAILDGRVVDAGGHAVAGARLVRQDPAEGGGFMMFMGGRERLPAAITAVDGSFRIDQLAFGPWRIEVRHDEHPYRTFEGVAEPSRTLTGGLEFRLQPSASVAGSVVDVPADERGELIVRAVPKREAGGFDFGFDVGGGGREGDVAADGSFEVRGLLRDGNYDLQLRGRDSSGFGFFTRSRSEKVPARSGERGVTIRYQPEGAVTFRVLDASTDEPLTSFRVDAGIGWPAPLLGDDGRRLEEHPDGIVRVGGLRPRSDSSSAQLQVRAQGYASFERDDIEIELGVDVDLGDIRLEPVPTVTVVVLDDKSGAPIEGATVRLEPKRRRGPGDGRTISVGMVVDVSDEDDVPVFWGDSGERTDEHGVAIVNSLEDETVTIEVRHDDYAPGRIEGVELDAGRSYEHTVRLTEGGAVVVTVLDPIGAPVKGARVEHRRARDEASGGRRRFFMGRGRGGVATDANGQARFAELEAGGHEFRLREESGGSGWAGNMAVVLDSPMGGGSDDWTRVDIAEGGDGAVVLTAAARSALHGVVRESGTPLAGASLSLAEAPDGDEEGESRMLRSFMPAGFGGGASVRTDGDGAYEFEGVKVGSYVLTITHPTRRMSAERTLEVREGETEFVVDLSVSVVEGRVVDDQGEPLGGVKVEAAPPRGDGEFGGMVRGFRMMMGGDADEGSVVSFGDDEMGGGSVTTDADGRFRLRGVTPDVELVVEGRGPGVQPGSSEPFVVGQDQVRTGVELVLAAGGSIDVEAFRADGTAASFCMVNATWAGADDVEAEPKFAFLQSGSTKLDGLRPGPWTVEVSPAGPNSDGGSVEKVVDVVGGETTKEAFHLP